MFSGKTSALLQLGDRYSIAGKEVCYFKPKNDNRYSDSKIVNHIGHSVTATLIDPNVSSSLVYYSNFVKTSFDNVVFLIDEIQFFDAEIVGVIEHLMTMGITVAVAGLDMDYLQKPFYNTALLMARATKVIKHNAVCTRCGADAVYSERTIDGEDIIAIGGAESYTAVCGKCYGTV